MLSEVLEGVLNCAYEGLTEKPGWYSVTPGPAVLEVCCNGQLWVNITGMTPMLNRGCVVGWNLTVSVGLARCIATVNDRGVSPTVAEIRADADMLLQDAEELMRALTCCAEGVQYVQKAVLGNYTPLDPNGGCAGGTWSLDMVVPTCVCE